MCRVLVSSGDFEAILTSFSEVFRNRFSLLPKEGEAGETTILSNFTKRRQNGFEIGRRGKYATHLR